MNPQRIEEFRKKLRAGQAARVRGGVVELDGATPEPGTATPGSAATAGAQAAPGGAPVPGPRPNVHGVQVKPHEWGAP